MSRTGGRAGVAAVDTLIGIAALSVVLALAYPVLEARGFRATLDEAAADVQAVRAVAEARLRQSATWPATADVGVPPADLAGVLPDPATFERARYSLEWLRFDVVDQVVVPLSTESLAGDAPPDSVAPQTRPVVRTLGAIAVHSRDEALLAGLQERFGSASSFIRGTTWTLVLPGRGQGS